MATPGMSGRGIRGIRSLIVGFAGAVTAMVGARADDGVAPRALGHGIPTFEAPAEPETDRIAQTEDPTGDLGLAEALRHALLRSPELADVSWEIRTREALALQASLLPNPEVSIETEQLGGTQDRDTIDSHQATLSIAQLVELGGKRSARVRLARAETTLAQWDFEAKRLAVVTDTARAFVRVLALQQRSELTKSLEDLATDTVRSVEATVSTGAVSPIETDRARVQLERIQLQALRTRHELEVARTLLAATWGASTASFTRAVGDLAAVTAPPPLEALAALVPENPDVARWNAEIAEREAALALERARRIPDVTIGSGPRYYTEAHDVALVMSVSVPLPLFDQNQGNILDSRHRLRRAAFDRRAAEVTVRSQLTATYQALAAAFGEVESLRDRVIPDAERVHRASREAYGRGLFRYVEVLDAQRTLFEARSQLVDALAAYHTAVADIERLTSTPLSASANVPGGIQP
ncbi:MAG: TolC family protein [Deltaproteobacteria bacterium]|nr:TolC family protein [Deltaproteobacteria bacterium]